ncbi:MAG: hypothetical protein J7641_20055 [Cyanobacteria bacterium SID2]|nr:hypothetical protein [Cyanobacteria bacterium SID2]MBP0005371.1 hypothetical protein [Cyanobacteria bacterium SBC]
MNLPLVVDIAIGLIFIYLILSLLASEIQELITTLFQWRAEHLRRSIQVLLEGGGKTRQSDRSEQLSKEVDRLTETLYTHPLINTLNQEAKGKFANLYRGIFNTVIGGCYKSASWLYQFLNRAFGRKVEPIDNPFDKQPSAPSYIPAESFASTVVETFQMSQVGRVVTLSRLEKFEQRQVSDVLKQIRYLSDPESRRLANERLRQAVREWNIAREDFSKQLTTLQATIDRMEHTFNAYIGYCSEFIQEPENIKKFFIHELQFIKDNYYSITEKPAVLTALKPSLNELVDLIQNKPKIYQELENAVRDKNSPTYQKFAQIIDSLPDLPAPVQQSLSALSGRIKSQKHDLEEELQDLQNEIERWFDASMTRAQGVYRRNARGIAIAIGFVVAVVTNTDTLFMVDSLSNNQILRDTVTDYAKTQLERDPSLAAVKENVRQELREMSLPLGWSEEIKQQQIPDDVQTFAVPNTQFKFRSPMPYLRRAFGWFVTGIAISMGSAFWYDLLKKVVNVKNTGGTGSDVKVRRSFDRQTVEIDNLRNN